MKILQRTGGIASTNSYVIADESANECVVIDAPDHTLEPLLGEVKRRGWTVTALWLTHGHFDHVADHAVVKELFPESKVLIHADDLPKLREPGAMLSGFQLPFFIPAGEADRVLGDGDEVSVGKLKARVLHTPGHSPGHVCFYFEGQEVLVGGDLIIGGAIGRTDFPDCSDVAMQESIRRVMSLPPQTRLFPGHGSPSTLEEERRENPYVDMAIRGLLAT